MTQHSIMIGVGAIIEDAAGRILLAKHVPQRGGFWQGKWICPGGKLELGETIEDGIKREVREETQLEIDLVKPLPPFDTIARSNGNVSLHVIYIDYLARVSGGSLKAGDDIGAEDGLLVEASSPGGDFPVVEHCQKGGHRGGS